MPNTYHVSLVIPFFNEVDNLPILVEEIAAALEPTGWTHEVLFIDDGSTDGSAQALLEATAGRPHYRLYQLAENSGQSAALAAGFRRCTGEVVVTLDADLQNDPQDIPALVEALTGHDMVSGIRAQRQDTLARRIASRVANRIRNWAVGDRVSDVGCSLKAYRGDLVKHLPVWNGMHRFLPALVMLLGAERIREIPVKHRPRRHGESKYNISGRARRGIHDLIGVRWLQSRWVDPRRLDRLRAVTPEDVPRQEPPGSASD